MLGHFSKFHRSISSAIQAVAGIAISIGAVSIADADSITDDIDAIAIDVPAVIYDSDVLRAGLRTTVTVEAQRNAGIDPLFADYRLVYRLRDSSGTALPLANGTVGDPLIAVSDPFQITFDNLLDFDLKQVEVQLYPDPVDTLSNKDESHTVEAYLERETGGVWNLASLTEVSGPQVVFHFTQASSGDAEWNIRAYVGNLAWQRKFLVDTDPDVDVLQASISALFARYDDYDLAIASVNTTLTLDFDLIEVSSDNSVPLVNDGKFEMAWEADSYQQSGADKIPVFELFSGEFDLQPVDQLESATETYKLVCSVSHIEDALDTSCLDAICELAGETLLHFNGDLLFGTVPATFNDLANVPVPGAFGAGYVETTIQVDTDGGQLPDRPDLAFGSGANLDVQLDDTGLATVTTGSELVYDPLAPADPLTVILGCTHLTYGPAFLSSGGLSAASVNIAFPQGLTYLADVTVDAHRGTNEYDHPFPIQLDSFANPDGALTIAFGPNAAVVDESHPLVFYVDNIVLATTGELGFPNVTSAEWIHAACINTLETDRSLNQIDAFSDQGLALEKRFSNDHYLYGTSGTSPVGLVVDNASDKSARSTVELNLAARRFTTHFPQQATVNWPAVGSASLSIVDGSIQDGSDLLSVNSVDLPYHQTCPDDPCADNVPKTTHSIIPDSNELNWTPGGGLYCRGSLSAADELAWGGRGDGVGGISATYPYAHRTDTFSVSDFFMPGYQLYAADNTLLTTSPYDSSGGDTAPSALLLSGYNGNPANPDLHLPTEPEYEDGDDHWPGANFVVQVASDVGASRLGGNTSDYTYTLLNGGASKYYIRCQGVFGRQVGEDGSFNPNLNVYGYDFTLDSFQASFIGSELEDSWIDGLVEVDGHCSFTQAFSSLRFDCIGELLSATIDPNDNTPKDLVYWNSTFDAKSMHFEKQLESAPGVCPEVYKGFLVMGIDTAVAHIPDTLHGTFAFGPDNPPCPGIGPGNLLTQVTGADIGIDCELGIPANLLLAQAAENYTLVPVGKLRFSNPDEDPNSVVGQPGGFVTFGCTVNVPYFTDLQTQVITSANPSPNALLYLTPGFTDGGGETFFSAATFDGNHAGWPVGAIPLAEFQQPDENTNPSYLIHAEQKLFDLVPLSYPLRFDVVTRTFKSMTPNNQELVILKMFHQVDYLDATATKLSFGAKYDGLPELNLANLLNEQIDQAASAVSDALSEPLKKGIDLAFERFEELLADSLDAVIDPVVDEAGTAILDPLCNSIESAYNTRRANGDTWADFKSDLDALLVAQLYDPNTPATVTAMRDQLAKLSQVGEDAASFTDGLKDGLEKAVIGIDSIVNAVELAQQDGVDTAQFTKDLANLSANASKGLLAETPSGEREIVSNLIGLLLDRLLEPEVAAVVTPLLQSASSELDQELNALLVDVDPALDQITNALSQVRVFLVEIHTVVDTAAGVISNFQDIVDEAYAASGEFETILAAPATRIIGFIEDIAKANGIDVVGGGDQLDDHLNVFSDIDKSVFLDTIKTELKDALIGSALVEQFQFLLRQTLYDFQASFEQTISSVLAQVTGVMKELINSTIGALEDKINPMLGDVNSVMGAAELSGYAEINGDSLRKLRIDLSLQLQIPDELEINAFLEVIAYTSEDGTNGCVDAGEKVVEVTVGATDVPFDWISDGLKASLGFKLSLKDKGSGLRPNGVGGFFEITEGEISFQTFKITCLAATVAFGADDAYFGAKACGIFNSYEIAIGIFFGKTCTPDPLIIVDEDVGTLMTGDVADYPLIGIYVYGQVTLPISELVLGIPASCLFNISAGVGAGVGFFLDGELDPIFVGKMFLGVYGEALCIVSIAGEVTLVGIVQDGSFSASGTGTLKGKVGWCPVCIGFDASANMKYNNGKWSVGT